MIEGGGGEDDLSGDWVGFYNYPMPAPPTQFEATLRDAGGLITGITSERGDSPDCLGMILPAVIEGQRDGAMLRFTKMYDYLERAPDVIHYRGAIQPGGDEIEGRWTIPGHWSGTFMMVRARKAAEEEEIRVGEEVPADR